MSGSLPIAATTFGAQVDIPLSNYSTWPNDRVLHDGEMVGVSTFSGYSYNERSYLSLAVTTPVGRACGTGTTCAEAPLDITRAEKTQAASGAERTRS